MKKCALFATLFALMSFSAEKNPPVFCKSLTPDGDGSNDVFTIGHLEEYPLNELTVYSRWGNKVYEASPYKGDWNGISNTVKKSEQLPSGTYFFTFTDKETHTAYNGFVEIMI